MKKVFRRVSPAVAESVFWPLFTLSKLALIATAMRERSELANTLAFAAVSGVGEIVLRKFFLSALAGRSAEGSTLLATLGNLVYAFCLVIDQRVFSAFSRPLDATLMREGTAAMPIGTMLSLFSYGDWAFIALALLTPAVLRRAHRLSPLGERLALPRVWSAFALAGCFSVGFLNYSGAPSSLLPAVLRLPMLALTPAQHKAVPAMVSAAPAFAPARAGDKAVIGTNVVLVVLESTGSRYVFDDKLTVPGAGVPMPYLKSLTQKSLYLARHYASSNSSPRAVFSLFTGLYPETSAEFFSLDKALRLRTFNTYLTPAEQYLVTPTATEWYFPAALLANNGLTDIIGISKLKFTGRRTHPDEARNEIQTADFFVSRLMAAREPFFSVYISFAPHFPYHDYGEDWQVAPGDSRLDRYVNNLRLLDAQLKKMIHTLEVRGVAHNTAVVIVGDHSEAFRQHRGNYIHSLFSYEENLAVPALIYFPGRVAPRTVHEPTTHADLAPTLLDILNIPYAASAFQGYSALRAHQREHIFAYGNEGTITAYGKKHTKLQYIPGEFCRTFDLLADPYEANPLGCQGHDGLRAAAQQFASSQTDYLHSLQKIAVKQSAERKIARGNGTARRRRSS